MSSSPDLNDPPLFLGDAHRHLAAQMDATPTLTPVIFCSSLPAQWPSIRKINQHQNQNQQNNNQGQIYGGYGVHPWEINSATFAHLQEQVAALPQFMAATAAEKNLTPLILGEIGLDFSPRYQAQRELQLKILEQFLDLPFSGTRILNLHFVKAWGEVLREPLRAKLFGLAKKEGARTSTKMILHAFQGSPEILQQVRSFSQVYFSYGLQHGAKDEVLRQIPPTRLLIESDLTRPASPAEIAQILQKTLIHLAQVWQMSPEQMSQQLQYNWQELTAQDVT